VIPYYKISHLFRKQYVNFCKHTILLSNWIKANFVIRQSWWHILLSFILYSVILILVYFFLDCHKTKHRHTVINYFKFLRWSHYVMVLSSSMSWSSSSLDKNGFCEITWMFLLLVHGEFIFHLILMVCFN